MLIRAFVHCTVYIYIGAVIIIIYLPIFVSSFINFISNTGENLGDIPEKTKVEIGGVPCQRVSVTRPHSGIACYAAPGSGTKNITININGNEVVSTMQFQGN